MGLKRRTNVCVSAEPSSRVNAASVNDLSLPPRAQPQTVAPTHRARGHRELQTANWSNCTDRHEKNFPALRAGRVLPPLSNSSGATGHKLGSIFRPTDSGFSQLALVKSKLHSRGWHGKIFCTHPHSIPPFYSHPITVVPILPRPHQHIRIPACLSVFCYDFNVQKTDLYSAIRS